MLKGPGDSAGLLSGLFIEYSVVVRAPSDDEI